MTISIEAFALTSYSLFVIYRSPFRNRFGDAKYLLEPFNNVKDAFYRTIDRSFFLSFSFFQLSSYAFATRKFFFTYRLPRICCRVFLP